MKKKSLKKNIEEKTVSLDELTAHFTKKDWAMVEDERKFYDMAVAIQETRRKLKLTQARLAQRAKIPRTTITKIESGQRNVRLDTLLILARAMGKKMEIRFV